jgi:hypothetical protein
MILWKTSNVKTKGGLYSKQTQAVAQVVLSLEKKRKKKKQEKKFED